MATQNGCNWNKYGYCKHCEIYRKLHVWEICKSSSCEVMCCLKRLQILHIWQELHTKDEVIDNLRKRVDEMEGNHRGKDASINDLIVRIKLVEDMQTALWNCYRNFTDQADYSNLRIYSTPSYLDSPVKGSTLCTPTFPSDFP